MSEGLLVQLYQEFTSKDSLFVIFRTPLVLVSLLFGHVREDTANVLAVWCALGDLFWIVCRNWIGYPVSLILCLLLAFAGIHLSKDQADALTVVLTLVLTPIVLYLIMKQ
jgi:phosphate/sulfate permease